MLRVVAVDILNSSELLKQIYLRYEKPIPLRSQMQLALLLDNLESYTIPVSTNTVQKRPGGRSAAVLNSVKVAVEELVQEKGRERVTIPMVAERAGVNPTSVY